MKSVNEVFSESRCDEVVSCPVCLSQTSNQPKMVVDGFPVVQCQSCLSGFLQDRHHIDVDSIYTEKYYEGQQKIAYSSYAASEKVIKCEADSVLKELSNYRSQNQVLLELGCAYGFFMEQARAQGYDTYGVEISDYARDQAQQKGLNVFESLSRAVCAFKEKQLKADIVVMLDVIEHFEEPSKIFDLLNEVCRSGTMIYISTGDFTSWHARFLGKRWRLMTPPGHIFYFSKKGLALFLARFGFEVESAQSKWKNVPSNLVFRNLGLTAPVFNKYVFNIKINLFDVMNVVAIKTSSS